jgi:hypothetical protein
MGFTISENSLLKSLQNVNIKARIEAVFRSRPALIRSLNLKATPPAAGETT